MIIILYPCANQNLAVLILCSVEYLHGDASPSSNAQVEKFTTWYRSKQLRVSWLASCVEKHRNSGGAIKGMFF